MDFTIAIVEGDMASQLDMGKYLGTKTSFIIGLVICMILGYSFLGTRLAMRMRDKRFKAKDWFAWVGLLLSTGFGGASSSMLDAGAKGKLFDYSMATLAAEILYVAGILSLKLSILEAYRRRLPETINERLFLAFSVANVVYSLIAFILLLVQRSPTPRWYAGGATVPRFDVKQLLQALNALDVATVAFPTSFLIFGCRLDHFKTVSLLNIVATTVPAVSVIALIFARTRIIAAEKYPTQKPLVVPYLSVLILTLLTITSTLVAFITDEPSLTLAEESELDHHHWRRPSGTDLSFSNRSDVALFGTQQRSRTPDQATLYLPGGINVKTEMTSVVEPRKGGTSTPKMEEDKRLCNV